MHCIVNADQNNNAHQYQEQLVHGTAAHPLVQRAAGNAAADAPPAIIKTRAGRVNSGTLWVIRVVSRLVIWLNRMMYRLFCAAVLVSMLKK